MLRKTAQASGHALIPVLILMLSMGIGMLLRYPVYVADRQVKQWVKQAFEAEPR